MREDISTALRDLRKAQNRANQQANHRPAEPLLPEATGKLQKQRQSVKYFGFIIKNTKALGLLFRVLCFCKLNTFL